MTARRKQGAGGSSNDAAVHDQSERQQHHRWRGGSGGDPFLLEQDVAWLGCSLLHKQRVVVIGENSDNAIGSRRKFAKRFAEGIRKLAGNAKGDYRKEDRRTCHKIMEYAG
ncbi:hypothetical protein BHE74_00058546, partial [Ensete ventricosum]